MTTATFDAAGNQLSLRDPNSIGWNATYDARNRQITMADTQEQAEGKNRQTVYDAHGNVVGTTDAKGQSASSAFDARDRRVSETDRIAGVTSWRFDENSNLRHLTDAENQSPYKPTAWTYDARNLKLSEALPGHNPASQIGDADYDKKEFAYDLAGRVEVATDQKGNNVTHLYDMASRLLQRDYRLFNQTAISDSDAFTYGDAGRMASAESGRYNNTVALGYDAAGRLTSESLTVTFGQTTTYTVQSAYDAANRRTGITYPDGSVVARTYTARDQLAQIDYNSAMVASFGYDNGSRRTSRTLGDTPGTQTTWTYGRQDNLPTAINAGIAGASFTYTYDANKNKLTEGISAPMANYGFNSTSYDPADRLTAWNRTDGNLDQAWNLSLVGNWATFTENQVQQTRTHTAVHEIAAIDANPIAHDPAGNLTRTAGDTFDRYTWDFDNRLATADVDQDGTPDSLYRHDALGRRVSKTVPDGEGSATTVFVGTIQELEYSPHAMQVVAEYPADAAPASPIRKFVYAEYIDEPVLMVRLSGPAETHYYYHQNSLYSVAAISDATGTVVERYAYSAYGEPLFLDAAANLLDPQATTIGNPYLFTGRRLDEETGLYYYRARMYDAELGRFVSRDPIGYESDPVNMYRYVTGQPLRKFDPSGLFYWWETYYTGQSNVEPVPYFERGFQPSFPYIAEGYGMIEYRCRCQIVRQRWGWLPTYPALRFDRHCRSYSVQFADPGWHEIGQGETDWQLYDKMFIPASFKDYSIKLHGDAKALAWLLKKQLLDSMFSGGGDGGPSATDAEKVAKQLIGKGVSLGLAEIIQKMLQENSGLTGQEMFDVMAKARLEIFTKQCADGCAALAGR